MNIKSYHLISLTAVLAFVLATGCSDSSTSVADSCNISLPSELAPVMFEDTYFQDQNIPFEEQYSTYLEVQSVATVATSLMSTMGPLGIGSNFLMLIQALSINPTVDGNSCNWSFQVPAGIEGGGGSITIIGIPVNNGVNWEVRIQEAGSSTAIPVLRGFTSTDNRSGEWRIYDESSPNTPAMVYTWQIQSQNVYSTNVSGSGSDGFPTLNYEKNGPENYLTSLQGSEELNAYWNENTNSGWIEDEDGRRCYTNFVNSGC
ncbi:MAG: hypothetical protein JJU37_13960 [Balneolaceae bacterium]|nr:hypothetical protein [Balneolaceae bacterium]